MNPYNPCLPGAPAITAEIDLRFRASLDCSARKLIYEFEIGGKHDLFPETLIFIDGVQEYEYDPCVSGTDPMYLFGPLHSFGVSWKTFREVTF